MSYLVHDHHGRQPRGRRGGAPEASRQLYLTARPRDLDLRHFRPDAVPPWCWQGASGCIPHALQRTDDCGSWRTGQCREPAGTAQDKDTAGVRGGCACSRRYSVRAPGCVSSSLEKKKQQARPPHARCSRGLVCTPGGPRVCVRASGSPQMIMHMCNRLDTLARQGSQAGSAHRRLSRRRRNL